MDIIEQILLGIALAMDVLAVSICLGLVGESKSRVAVEAGLWFGFFQGLMALVGFLLGTSFKTYIERIDHWIAFVLLLFIGLNMIKESIESKKLGDSCERKKQNMFVLAIATSIDALAVGVSLSIVTDAIISPVIIITLITAILSAVGVLAGNKIGARRKYLAELSGGLILIAIGVKILIEHTLL